MRFLALDFETSGLDPKLCAPTSLAVALFDGETVAECKEWIFERNDEKAYYPKALAIQGRSFASLKDGISAGQLVRELSVWLADHDASRLPVVAFNAVFDMSFFEELLYSARTDPKGAGAPSPLMPCWWCAKQLFKRAYPSERSHRLDDAVRVLDLPKRVSDRHGSAEDAYLAGRIFWALWGSSNG